MQPMETAKFWQVFKDEIVVFKRYIVRLLQDAWSVVKVLHSKRNFFNLHVHLGQSVESHFTIYTTG